MSGGFDPLVPREIDLPTPVPLALSAADPVDLDEAKIFAAPADPADRPAWRRVLENWRTDAAARLDYDGQAYDHAGAQWAQRCFTVAQVWLWDELFFDFAAAEFTPQRFLDDAQQRFGGLDGVVLWHAYPIIGIDDRNQWDFYRQVPGLAQLVKDLQAAGVAVFVDYNPWDVGTRRGADDVTELAALVRDLGVDGVFLDTLKKADPELVAAVQAARPGFVLEGESKLALERIADHQTSWAQWFADSEVPGVLRAHWFERRHMHHHIRRWHRDHSGELASAWLNGVGVMVWEVVFGAWVGWSARDAATLRRMLPVLRGFADVLQGDWTPLVDLGAAAEAARVYGSLFVDGETTLLLVANRGPESFTIDLESFTTDHLGALAPLHEGGAVVPAGGVAAFATGPRVEQVRHALAGIAHDDDAAFVHRRARRLTPRRLADAQPSIDTGEATATTGATPSDTDGASVMVPAGEYTLTVRYRMRETGMYDGAPYVDEWKPLPPRLHDQRTLERHVTVPRAVQVAATEVTAGEAAAVLGLPVPADPSAPATGITLAQARAYAAAVGSRLPTEDEWQLAASQPGWRRSTPAVWNWTESEHSDGRTRFVMLKGGADHRSEGSDWYTDGGVQPPEFSLKFLLPGLGLDASPSIGFRVCWEVAP